MTDTLQDNAMVVRTQNLTRKFGGKKALRGVSMNLPKGRVLGLLGENGAGKTTLIRLLMGMLEPTAGAVEVFGLNPAAHPVEVLSRVGFLSEDRDMPKWMRVRELMRYTQGFYPGWDTGYAAELMALFNLDPEAKLKNLSRGQLAGAGLIAALAYRPPLLLLDEPSSGLDPAVRRNILATILRGVAEEGRTVLFSSHLLDEVDRIADDITLIHEGRVALEGPLDDIRQEHLRVTVRLDEASTAPPDLSGVVDWEGRNREWTALYRGAEASFAASLNGHATLCESCSPSLEEIFLAYVKPKQAVVGGVKA